jgi:hypothetical protein
MGIYCRKPSSQSIPEVLKPQNYTEFACSRQPVRTFPARNFNVPVVDRWFNLQSAVVANPAFQLVVMKPVGNPLSGIPVVLSSRRA